MHENGYNGQEEGSGQGGNEGRRKRIGKVVYTNIFIEKGVKNGHMKNGQRSMDGMSESP